MADDIRVHVLSEVEPDGKSARICVGVTIRDLWQARGV